MMRVGAVTHDAPIVTDYGEAGATRTMGATVLLDRDGVINANRPDHVKSWSEFAFLPTALDGLALLTQHGFPLIVISNQAVINRGLVTVDGLREIHDRMVSAVAGHGGRILGIVACPHRPEEGCSCRKPAPGMLLEASRRFGVALEQSVLIGDHESDLQAAAAAGSHAMLVTSGRTSGDSAVPVAERCLAVVPNLGAAARFLIDRRAS
jgi:D-glycero-D-manno-heptose 1,7-bisphosphate phosphatase